ncbi:atypical chemokine receptor 3-like [Cyprinodon tularosa]|uniref:atypical chemokine receptor 3-like n=1 Tax=Cyprinodon tularosa TaxID=77115 RepID=UPI0018E28A56|nr:atypical chemokine receptor 3-like [Cyprinodon tularosa]XP_038160715.1 atypical chemokine receptor 3-like [Cyprinodon tularosa]
MSNSSHYNNSTSSVGGRVRPLWYHYPECVVAPQPFVFYFVVKVFNLVVGTPGNIFVIWQIISKKKNTSTSDIFIFNLAVLDAYFCLMSTIEMVNRLELGDEKIWIFQRFAYGVKDLAPLFLVCICVDRYMAVVHPVFFSTYQETVTRILICVVVWMFILPYSIIKGVWGIMSVSGIFGGVILFAFAVMLFCNISVIWVLRHSVAGKETMHPVKKRAFKMVLKNLGIIVFNYLPPVAFMPFVSYYTYFEYRCQISISVFSIMDLSCSIEPLLYVTKMDGPNCMCCKKASETPTDVKV